MEPLSYFGSFVHKVIISCFSDSFVQKTTQQSDGSMLQKIPSSYRNYSKSLFISANTNEKDIVSKEYCIPRHDKICFLPNCRYHSILIGDIKELQQKMDTFCFNYQHVDCLYTLFKYRFSGKIVVKSGQLFENVQRAVHFNHQNREVNRMSSIAKKSLLRKKYQKTFVELLPKE